MICHFGEHLLVKFDFEIVPELGEEVLKDFVVVDYIGTLKIRIFNYWLRGFQDVGVLKKALLRMLEKSEPEGDEKSHISSNFP